MNAQKVGQTGAVADAAADAAADEAAGCSDRHFVDYPRISKMASTPDINDGNRPD